LNFEVGFWIKNIRLEYSKPKWFNKYR